MLDDLYKKGKISVKTYCYIDSKYKKRDDKDNVYGIGMDNDEFRYFIINELLGDNWYVVDPLSQTQINEIAFYEIMNKYKKEGKRK